ncbi:hypothetical protein ACFL6O_00155 [candidate division KSB1 bacterium]
MPKLIIKLGLILSLSHYALVFGITRDNIGCEESPPKNPCCCCSEANEKPVLQPAVKNECGCIETPAGQLFLKSVYLTASAKNTISGTGESLTLINSSASVPEQKDTTDSNIYTKINSPPKLFLLNNSLLI